MVRICHGAMVRRRLSPPLERSPDEAEDAFQATFLVLARRAAAVRKQDSVASWLYGVAYRAEVSRRAQAGREPQRPRAVGRAVEPVSTADPTAEAAWRELRPVIDEELSCLPEKYRAPLVLCYLEGKTNEEAARLLGWTKGTVSGRLQRGGQGDLLQPANTGPTAVWRWPRVGWGYCWPNTERRRPRQCWSKRQSRRC